MCRFFNFLINQVIYYLNDLNVMSTNSFEDLIYFIFMVVYIGLSL